MGITLSDDTQKLIEAQLKRGHFGTADEVVRAGLASLEQQESAGDFTPGELDALLAEGESGGGSLDGEQVLRELAELRNRHSSGNK